MAAAKEFFAITDHEVVFLEEVTDFFFTKSESGKSWYGNDNLNLAEFDVVLTDVNLPGAIDKGRGESLTAVGPIGLLVAMKAIQQGVKYIGVITDANHHEPNPISKGFDMFVGKRGFFVTGKSTILMQNGEKGSARDWGGWFDWLVGSTD